MNHALVFQNLLNLPYFGVAIQFNDHKTCYKDIDDFIKDQGSGLTAEEAQAYRKTQNVFQIDVMENRDNHPCFFRTKAPSIEAALAAVASQCPQTLEGDAVDASLLEKFATVCQEVKVSAYLEIFKKKPNPDSFNEEIECLVMCENDTEARLKELQPAIEAGILVKTHCYARTSVGFVEVADTDISSVLTDTIEAVRNY